MRPSLGLAVIMLLAQGVFASDDPEPPHFQTTGQQPWVVMVTQPGCSFCERLERQVLQPLRASKLYQNKVRFTEVDIGVNPTITDFDGARISSIDFASRYQGNGTPTLLFLSASGEPLAAPKYGVPDAIDFYAYGLEQTIDSIVKGTP